MKNLGKTCCRFLLSPICPDMYVCSCLSCNLILNSTATLDLSSNTLSGTIPSEIGLLSNLSESICRFLLSPICPDMYVCSCLSCNLILNSTDTLDLSSNTLSGTIPSEIGLLSNLSESCCRFLLSPICPDMYVCSCLSCNLILNSTDTLGLSFDTLNGTIPTEIGLMKNLGKTYCRLLLLPICPDMYMCSLLFCITILHSIESLFLGINTLSGSSFLGTIPSEIGLLSNLGESCCRLLLLPICPGMYVISCLSCNLILNSTATLRLSFDTLNGTIPTEIGLMKNLGKTYCRLLLLPICPDMYVCSLLFCILILHSIEYLFLGINTLSGNSFFGTISNTLMGTIPSEIGLLSNLGESCCRLLLLPICPGMYVISCLSCNLILNSTATLRLSFDTLNGTIPTEIGLMKNLGNTYCRLLLLPICPDMYVCSLLFCILILHSIEYLFLGINTLSGNSFFGTVSNTLMGTIPSEIGLLSNLGESCCRFLLLPICPGMYVISCLSCNLILNSTATLGLSFDTLNGTIPTKIGLMKNLGKSCCRLLLLPICPGMYVISCLSCIY